MQRKVKQLFRNGTVIQGKWHHHQYTIIRPLGSGTVGEVYLCRKDRKHYALKISLSSLSLTREVTILKALNKARGKHLGPFLFDVDDFHPQPGRHYTFYVMEYIEGVSVESYIRKNGASYLAPILLQMLETLEHLHKLGYIYGDLKNENLLVASDNQQPIVRFIDVGGVTRMGSSVKEYSNFFDRGYWQSGSRQADVKYDLFALVMVILAVYYPKRFKRQRNYKHQLIRYIQRVPQLRPFQHSFQKALQGSYSSAKAMRREIELVQRNAMHKQTSEAYFPQVIILLLLSGGSYIISLFL